ncbi:MAG: hypothetical protein H7Y86_04790 [Rhizobacter sp.]|nr:hypothetical protein [Ferruginibacter sp.]
MIDFEQVIYIESGKLKNFIYLVSPKYSVVTSQGNRLGYSIIFSTGLNTKKSHHKKIKKKALHLGQTRTRYLLKDSGIIMLKQLHGQHLLEVLWPHFSKATYEIIRLDSSKKISFKELDATILGCENGYVPVYDAEGNVSEALPFGSPVNASVFSSFILTREWLYSKEKNILLCNIPSITLYYFKKDNVTAIVTETPVIKINIK